MGQSTFYSTRVISMDMNTNKHNIGLLDTRDLAFTILCMTHPKSGSFSEQRGRNLIFCLLMDKISHFERAWNLMSLG